MNKKKYVYIVLGVIAVCFLFYHSVYFTSLSERKELLNAQIFDPKNAIEQFWKEAAVSLPEKAVELTAFDAGVTNNATELALNHGRTLGIGAPYSILLKGVAAIKEVKDEVAILQTNGEIRYSIRLSSIFSNTVREASGYFDLDAFETTMDFNLVAIEVNDRIVKEVINPVVQEIRQGAIVEFIGAADLNLRKLPVTSVEIIPIQLKIVQP